MTSAIVNVSFILSISVDMILALSFYVPVIVHEWLCLMNEKILSNGQSEGANVTVLLSFPYMFCRLFVADAFAIGWFGGRLGFRGSSEPFYEMISGNVVGGCFSFFGDEQLL